MIRACNSSFRGKASTTYQRVVYELFIAVAGVASLGQAGCRYDEPHREAIPGSKSTESQSAEPMTNLAVGPSPHHWIQHDELYAVMKRLDARTSGNWPASLPEDPEVAATPQMREQAFREGAKLAAALAESAKEIPRSVADFPLSDADRTMFVGNADLLRDQARELGRAARSRNVESMHRQLDAIRSSCISCHTRFKDISGDLPPRT